MNKEILNQVKEKVIEEINKRYEAEESVENFMYVVPYKSIPVTMPSAETELPIILKDVVLAVKQKEQEGNVIRLFELYDIDANKLMETHDDGKVEFEKEILDDLIQQKVNTIVQAGYEAAGVTINKDQTLNSSIESYFELIEKRLVVLNKEQKERLEKSEDRNATLSDIANENLDAEEDKDDKEKEEKSEDRQNKKIEQEAGIDSIHKKVKMNDNIFEQNTKADDDVEAVLTHSGKLEFVEKNEKGVYQRSEAFKEGTAETDRIAYATKDNAPLKVKNTYGKVKAKNADTSYAAMYDQYGGIQVAEIRETSNGKGYGAVSGDKIAREAQSDNTNYEDINFEGDNNKDNITAETFKTHSTNRNASYYGDSNGNGGLAEIAENIKKHGEPIDFTMEGFSADASLRINEALNMVQDELKKRKMSLNNDEEERLQEALKSYLGNSSHVFRKEEAEQYVNEIQQNRNNKEDKENEDKQNDDKGRSRLEEAMERRKR